MKNRSKFWNPQTYGYRFLTGAKRLRGLEPGRTKLTAVQACGILFLYYASNAMDKAGWSY